MWQYNRGHEGHGTACEAAAGLQARYSLPRTAPGPVWAGQPQSRPAVSLALPRGIQMAPQRLACPVGLPQPGTFKSPVKATLAFPPVSQSLIAGRSFAYSSRTANAPLVQPKSIAQPLFRPVTPAPEKALIVRPMAVPRAAIRQYPPAPGRFRAGPLAGVHPAIQMAMVGNRGRQGAQTSSVVIQPALGWATEKLSTLGEWITGHPAPKTFSALLSLTEGIISTVAVGLQTTGVAIAGSVTKLLQSISSAAKLAAKYSQEGEEREKKKLKAQLIVECVNILISIVTLILSTQGQLAAAVWTNAITTVLAKSTGEIYEVYCEWKAHNNQSQGMDAPLLV